MAPNRQFVCRIFLPEKKIKAVFFLFQVNQARSFSLGKASNKIYELRTYAIKPGNVLVNLQERAQLNFSGPWEKCNYIMAVPVIAKPYLT